MHTILDFRISFKQLSETQIEDSGDRILQEPAESRGKNYHILKEKAGNRWKMEAVFSLGNLFQAFPLLCVRK